MKKLPLSAIAFIAVVAIVVGIGAIGKAASASRYPSDIIDRVPEHATREQVKEILGEPLAYTTGDEERFLVLNGKDNFAFDKKNKNAKVSVAVTLLPLLDGNYASTYVRAYYPAKYDNVVKITFDQKGYVLYTTVDGDAVIRSRVEDCERKAKDPTEEYDEQYIEKHP